MLDLASPDFSTRSKAVSDARTADWCANTPYGLAVLRHREVGLLLRDPRLRQGSYAWPDTNRLQGSFAEFWKRSIISQEGDWHRRLRKLIISALADDFIESLVPQFKAAAEQLTEPLKHKSRCEFMHEFSAPFAGMAICILLGLDRNDWPVIAQDASRLGLAMGVECKRHEPEFNAACDRLMELADGLVTQARSQRGRESLITRLVRRCEEDGMDNHQALLDLIVIAIFGGVDTTKSQLGFAMALFIEHPDQWQNLRQNPDLVTNTVEEIIRAWPTTTWATREAIEDFHFGGHQIRAGQTLHMLVHASSRDPRICNDPRFDITRRRKIHFGFGGGAHHCIGHKVARTDMACAMRVLAQSFHSLRFYGRPEYLPDSGNTSPVTLPIEYEPGR